MQAGLFSSYRFTIAAAGLAVVASRFLPSKYKYTPLVLFGSLAAVGDMWEGQRTAEQVKQELQRAQQVTTQSAPPLSTSPPDASAAAAGSPQLE